MAPGSDSVAVSCRCLTNDHKASHQKLDMFVISVPGGQEPGYGLPETSTRDLARLRAECGLAAVSLEGLTGDPSTPKLTRLSVALSFLQSQARGALLLSGRQPPAAPWHVGLSRGCSQHRASRGVTELHVCAGVFLCALGLTCVRACEKGHVEVWSCDPMGTVCR